MKIKYDEFEKNLQEEGYTERECRHLFRVAKEMDNESRHWVLDWIYNKNFPEVKVENITAEQLVKKYGIRPMNAFIMLDWLKTDPKAAKFFITKYCMSLPEGLPEEENGEITVD